jgi:hypothetical protein
MGTARDRTIGPTVRPAIAWIDATSDFTSEPSGRVLVSEADAMREGRSARVRIGCTREVEAVGIEPTSTAATGRFLQAQPVLDLARLHCTG